MGATDHSRASSSRLSLPLLVCSAFCVAGLCAWYANSRSKDGWSTTPLFWMFVLAVAPVLCFAGGLILAREASRLCWFDRLAMTWHLLSQFRVGSSLWWR